MRRAVGPFCVSPRGGALSDKVARVEPVSQSALLPAVSRDSVIKLCREVLAPLIEADGGEMYLVAITGEDIHVHLAGTCAGCPGSSFTAQAIVGPALSRLAPKLKLRLTTGWRVPAEAERMDAKR
jgi:Fe-S cluster biogenesis protein NfuA